MAVLANRSYIDALNCARVYCCLAYKDAYLLEDIASDIFACYDHDLFVSFRKDIQMGDKGTGTELTGDLSEAQLMIVIISGEFLNQGNSDGSMEEFEYAVTNKIPILPIAVESDLEDTYNKKCGKLELIYKYSDAYYDVLSANLNRILMNAEISKQIREHFYGNIFLSYRRLDLKYAKEVMALVHGFENCRDVGIWYDGALVPGKDYEEEIFEHLRECDVVLMIVTSRLLEPGNFIMKEFPRVKEMNMKVIPYVVDDVDVNELSEHYAGLFDEYPDGIRNEDDLKRVLDEIYTDHTHVWDGEHDFYIGQAHLYGIDFEKDSQKAVDYFKSSADKGKTDALRKLVEIYENGDAGDKNLQDAILFQKRYIEKLYERVEMPCKSSNELLDALFKLGSLFEENKQYPEARQVYNKAFELYDLNPGEEQGKDYYLCLSQIYERLGVLEKTLSNYDEARLNLFKAEKYIDEAERVTAEPGERADIGFRYAELAEKIAMTIFELDDGADLHIADLYIQLAIKPYEENGAALDNRKKSILSRLYYEEAEIDRKSFDMMLKSNEEDKKVFIEQLDFIIGSLKNAMEFCTETNLNKSIGNIEAYYNTTMILEDLKNAYYAKYFLEPTSANLNWYEGYLRQMMDIFIRVKQTDTARNSLIKKVNESIHMGEFLAEHRYNKRAKDFYQLALKGMRAAGYSERDKEILNTKMIIVRLSRQ